MRTLYLGLSGDDVRAWQHFLIGQLDDDMVDTGVFDQLTKQSTITFQRLHSLGSDGIVGHKTLGAAMALGFDPLSDDHSGEDGPNWPSRPPGGSLQPDDRAHVFGTFAYKEAGTAVNPEAIIITDGWVLKNIVSIEVPQLSGITRAPPDRRVLCHQLIASQLQRTWLAWEAAGLLGLVQVWNGSWAPRFIRGSRTVLSNHTWGTAFDINASWNALGTCPPLKGQRGSVRELVDIAYQNGFYWGGWFQTRQDGMHFESYKVMP